MAEENPFTPIPNYDWTVKPGTRENEKHEQKGIPEESPGIHTNDVDLWVRKYVDSIPTLDKVDEVYRATQANSLDETKTMEPEVVGKLCDFIG